MKRQTFFLLAVLLISLAFDARSAAAGSSTSETEPFDRIVLKDMTVIKASLVKEMGDSLAYFELNDPDFVKHTVGRDQVFKWIHATLPATSPRKVTPPPAPVVSNVEQQNRAPAQNVRTTAAVQESEQDGVPVVDYQSVVLRSDAAERGGIQRPTIAEAPVRAETSPAVPAREPAALPSVDYNRVNETAQIPSQQRSSAIDSSRIERQSPPPQPEARFFSKRAKTAVSAPPEPPAPAVTANVSMNNVSMNYDTNDAIPAGLSQVRLDPPTRTDGVKVVPRSGMLAINILPSLSSIGVGLRNWGSTGWGFGAKGSLLWLGESGFNLSGEVMKALNSEGRARWYLFAGLGYQWMSITTPEIMGIPGSTIDLSLPNFIIGLGGEWRFGINRNHGVSFELGYQAGSADYTIHQPAYTIGGYYTVPATDTKGSYSMPFYFGGAYAYYF
ncbi:MAG: hypothetical protein ABSF80_07485 [Chitinispirillaceae bacterium]|jgi:hypothetical protein